MYGIAAQAGDTGALEGFLALPVHPIFVHFPIALFVIATVLVYLRHWRQRPDLEQFIAPSLRIGVAMLPILFITGFRDAEWGEFLVERAWNQPLIWHFVAATATSVAFTWYLVARQRWAKNGRIPPRADLGFATAGMWLLLMTGLIAGEMVYG